MKKNFPIHVQNFLNNYPLEVVTKVNFGTSWILSHPKTNFGRQIVELANPSCCYSDIHISLIGKAIIWKYEGNHDEVPKETIFIVAVLNQSTPLNDTSPYKVCEDALLDFSSRKCKHLCIAASSDGKSWVLLFFFKEEDQVHLLYFDPWSKPIPPSLKFLAENGIIQEMDIHLHEDNFSVTSVSVSDTAPICLRYFDMIMAGKQDNSNFLHSWRSKSYLQVFADMNLLPYQRGEELKKIKYNFQEKCYQELVLTQFATRSREIPYQDFVKLNQDLNKYLEELLNLQKVQDLVTNYLPTLKNALESPEDRRLDSAESHRQGNTFFQKMIQRGVDIFRAQQLFEPFEHCIIRGEDFISLAPNLNITILEGLSLIENFAHDKNICTEKLKTEISKAFGFADEISQKLFHYETIPTETHLDDEEAQKLLEFLQSLDLMSSNQQGYNSLTEIAWKSFGQLVKEFLHENKLPDHQSDQLTQAYNSFMETSSKWRQASSLDISTWVESPSTQISEIVAIVDRANEITRNGQRLNTSQILTLLQLGNSSATKDGKICRIYPGEDQTTLVAMLAVMKFLCGERSIDIITLTPELAEEALKNHFEFYDLFGISVATNNKDSNDSYVDEHLELRKCYIANIVYGTLNNFKEDYLLDMNGTLRGDRKLGFLILDEIGPVMTQDACDMTSLSNSFPGFDIIKEIFDIIWSSLILIDDVSCQNEVEEQLNAEKSNLKLDGISPVEARQQYNNLRQAMEMTVYDSFYSKVKELALITYNCVMADKMNEFVESCIYNWIDSALIAKYLLKENLDYYFEPGKDNQIRVVPMEKGKVIDKKISWSKGIHQFLQMKHNLNVTMEWMNICSISNYGYISLYGSNIIGLTCTLGSETEQKLLQEMYSVSFLRIPTSRCDSSIKELPGRIISDRNWHKYVTVEANMKAVQEARAVLIICNTVEDCQKIEFSLRVMDTIAPPARHNVFEKYLNKFRTIRVFTDDFTATVSPNVMYPGDVVVVVKDVVKTIALKPSTELNLHGGLHICLGFCPTTKREKEMLLRISARQVDTGSMQILMRTSRLQLPVEITAVTNENNETVDSPEILNENSQVEQWEIEEEARVEETAEYLDEILDGFDEGISSVINSESDSDEQVSRKFQRENLSKLDEHLIFLLMGFYWPNYEVKYDSDTARLNDKMAFIWNKVLADKTERERKELADSVEYLHESCYKNQLSRIEDEIQKTNRSLENFHKENMQDFSHSRAELDKIHQFWSEPNEIYPSEEDEIRDKLLKNDENCMENLRKRFPTLFFQESVNHKFWTFCRSNALKVNGFNSSKVYLENLWGMWTYTKDWNKIYRSLSHYNEILQDNKCEKDLLMTKWNKISEGLFQEFHKFSSATECRETSLEGAPLSWLDFQSLQSAKIITHLNDNHYGSSEVQEKPDVKKHKNKFQAVIQETALTLVEQLGLDLLQYFKSKNEISDLNIPGEIAFGIGAISVSKTEFIPSFLSDATSLGVTLIMEGALKIMRTLLQLDDSNLDETSGMLIIYAVNLISSRNFEICLRNAQILERAANECLSLHKQLKISQANSDFNLWFHRLGLELKRILSAMKYLLKQKTQQFPLRHVELPMISSNRENLLEDCRQAFGAKIMNRIGMELLESVMKGCKPTIKSHIKIDIDRLNDKCPNLRYIDEITFLDGCLDSFDDCCQAACQVWCDDVIKETRECLEKSPCEDIYKISAWTDVREIMATFIYKLKNYLNNCQTSSRDFSTEEVLLEYASEFIVDKIYETLQQNREDSTQTLPHGMPLQEEGAENWTYPSLAYKHTINTSSLYSKSYDQYYIRKISNQEFLLKYHLAYMLDTAKLVQEMNYLYYLKAGGPISLLEDANILVNYLGCSLDIRCVQTGGVKSICSDYFGKLEVQVERKWGSPRGHYNFICEPCDRISSEDVEQGCEDFLNFLSRNATKPSRVTSRELRNHLIRFRENKIKTHVEWHRQFQSEYRKLMGGTYRFKEKFHADGVTWSRFDDFQIVSEVVLEHSEDKAGDMQELNSILKVNDQLQFGHAIAKHSSREKGIQFVKGNRKLKHVSTFESLQHQILAFQSCLKIIRSKEKVLPLIRGIDYEVNIDASILDLTTPLLMHEIKRNKNNKVECEDVRKMVRFITLILGRRHASSVVGKKELFHVHTIVPRSERPDGLLEGEPYRIKIRTWANERYMDMEKWYAANNKFFQWKEKPFGNIEDEN